MSEAYSGQGPPTPWALVHALRCTQDKKQNTANQQLLLPFADFASVIFVRTIRLSA